MKITEAIKKIKLLLQVEDTIKLEQMVLIDGVTILEADAFEAGNAVFIVTETDRVPLPIGEYELEDGRILVVEVEGTIASISEPEAPAEEAPAEEAPVEEEEMEAQVVTREEFDALVAEIQTLKDQLTLSEITVATQQVEISTLKTELSNVPAAKKIVHNPGVETNLNKGKKGKTPFDSILNRISK